MDRFGWTHRLRHIISNTTTTPLVPTVLRTQKSPLSTSLQILRLLIAIVHTVTPSQTAAFIHIFISLSFLREPSQAKRCSYAQHGFAARAASSTGYSHLHHRFVFLCSFVLHHTYRLSRLARAYNSAPSHPSSPLFLHKFYADHPHGACPPPHTSSACSARA